jgi:phage tail-like protein
MSPAPAAMEYPLHLFNFLVELRQEGRSTMPPLCRAAFSECSGLEATMEPKVIKEGGRNYGAVQRVGPVSFATVILKRGITTNRDLWQWFQYVSADRRYSMRLAARISIFGAGGQSAGQPVYVWQLTRALPVKFKAGDLNARSTEVGLEELHLAHEGLALARSTAARGGRR